MSEPEIADRLSLSQPARKIDFMIEDGLHACVDPVLARMILDNLLSNAVKYTSKKHHALIEFGRTSHDTLSMSTFFVRDNGDGFESNDAQRLFRPLVRLHSDTEFPGTGPGLASTRN